MPSCLFPIQRSPRAKLLQQRQDQEYYPNQENYKHYTVAYEQNFKRLLG